MDTIHKVSVDKITIEHKKMIESYNLSIAHTPAMVRNSMMIAFKAGCDRMLKAMDRAKIND